MSWLLVIAGLLLIWDALPDDRASAGVGFALVLLGMAMAVLFWWTAVKVFA